MNAYNFLLLKTADAYSDYAPVDTNREHSSQHSTTQDYSPVTVGGNRNNKVYNDYDHVEMAGAGAVGAGALAGFGLHVKQHRHTDKILKDFGGEDTKNIKDFEKILKEEIKSGNFTIEETKLSPEAQKAHNAYKNKKWALAAMGGGALAAFAAKTMNPND